MQINGREISGLKPPYIVAEVGASHGGSLERAVEIMRAALFAGADAVKFQCYTPDTITIDCDNPDFIIKDGPWKGRNLYELYGKAHTPFEWFPGLFRVSKGIGITAFASVFDRSSVDFLETLNCPAYKIASMEIVDIPLIRHVSATGKPIIISTGMATDREVDDALLACHSDTATLYCVSGYPAKAYEMNLGELKINDGISDHTQGWEIPVAATALGANIIEKHIKYWGGGGEDDDFALDPYEFRNMCRAVRSIWGAIQYSKPKSEDSSRQLRRSLYIVEDVSRGDILTEKNVRSIRPAYGLHPKYLDHVLGRAIKYDVQRGTALAFDMVEGMGAVAP